MVRDKIVHCIFIHSPIIDEMKARKSRRLRQISQKMSQIRHFFRITMSIYLVLAAGASLSTFVQSRSLRFSSTGSLVFKIMTQNFRKLVLQLLLLVVSLNLPFFSKGSSLTKKKNYSNNSGLNQPWFQGSRPAL